MVNIKKTNKEITQKLNKIENALKRKLDAFYNNNIKGSILPIESLRNKYNNTVKNLIRQTVQQGYLTGSDIVTNQISNINSDFVPFISITDVQNIQLVTEKVSNQFWKTADRLHRRETEATFIVGGDLIPKPEFDTTAAIIGLSAFATFSAFSTATMSKIQIVNQLQPILVGEEQLLLETGFPLQGKLMFLTREDGIVGPECEIYNRTIYDATDLDIPGTEDGIFVGLHNHCRCRLVPIVDEFSANEASII